MNKKRKKKQNPKKAEEFSNDFAFAEVDEDLGDHGLELALRYAKPKGQPTTLDEKIATMRRERKKRVFFTFHQLYPHTLLLLCKLKAYIWTDSAK